MKDYSKMSDFDVNVSVAEQLGINWYCSAQNSPSGGWEYCSAGELMIKDDSPLKDYCNNPSDAWPIINIERIGVYPSEGPDFMPWIAAKNAFSVTDKNPLRAAMIVYLMMKDEEQ